MFERRKRIRFPIEQPGFLKVLGESGPREIAGIVEVASDGGVLFVGESELVPGTKVEIIILLPKEIRVSACGTVVRSEARAGGKNFATAVECSRTFSESIGIFDCSPNLSLTVEKPIAANVIIVHCEGRIAREESEAFRQTVSDLLAGTPRIVIDLKSVHYIDSGGLGILTGLFTSAKRRGGELTLVSPSPRAKDVLRRTRLDTIFVVYETERDAVLAYTHRMWPNQN